jgi:drug/metabolite transporter (DMT)-like permease
MTAGPRGAAVALGTIYVVWGSTYLAIRLAVESVPPLLGAGVRFLLAGVVLAALIAIVRGPRALPVTRRELLAAAVSGVLILVGGIGLLTLAEQETPSSLAALLIASVPLWVIVFRRLAHEEVPRAAVAGVLLGALGVGLVVAGGLTADVAAWAVAVLLVSGLLTGLGLFLSPRLGLPADALVGTAWEMLIAGALLTVVGLALGDAARADALTARSLAALLYLVVFGSVVAYGAFVWALGHVDSSLVATYAFVNPVVAIVLGWLLLDERLTAAAGAGAALVVAGVAAVATAGSARA